MPVLEILLAPHVEDDSTSFSFVASANASATLAVSGPDVFGAGTGIAVSEEPTITYTPLQGEDFVKQLRVRHRGSWFFIDAADLDSKSTFSLLSQLLALQSGEVPSQAPVLTLPVGR